MGDRRGSFVRRREFLWKSAAAAVWTGAGAELLSAIPEQKREEPTVVTVLGAIRPADMEVTLSHEHVLVDFVGADKSSPARYDRDKAYVAILPYLQQVRKLGCRTLVECTPAYLGRDPQLLVKLAKASGLHLLTNTGYYGAGDNKFLPRHAFSATVDELTATWVKECQTGIDGTGVRPGFIKIGVGGQMLSQLHRNLVRAAARAHLATGLTVASHTGGSKLALEQLDLLRDERVSGAAFIWVHAQAEPDPDICCRVAERGCWVSFDGFTKGEAARYTHMLKVLRQRGYLKQVLISHDAGWYHPEDPNGEFRPFDAVFRVLVPSLRQAGFTRKDVDQLLVSNPATAFSVHVRKL